MARKPKQSTQSAPITEHIPSVKGGLSALASANAPIIFVDQVVTAGFYNGIAHMTLTALRFVSVNGAPTDDLMVTGYLRMNWAAVMALKSAITHIENVAADMAKKTATETQH